MTEIKLFGASTLAGQYFKNNYRKYFNSFKLSSFSRSNKTDIYFDLTSSIYPKELILENKTLIISMAPIWLFVPFFKKFYKEANFKKIKGLIIVSSTSVTTKKYSWNNFDKKLYSDLSYSEKELLNLQEKHNIKITIIRPSLIYGNIGYEEDKNLSFLIRLIKATPFIPIPNETGIRQPIHYSQLVKCVIALSKSYLNNQINKKDELNILNIGGDEELTFEKLLSRLEENFKSKLKFRRCLLVKIPNRIFFFLFSPLIIFSPRYYAAILRISINMGGFQPSYKIHGDNKVKFPLKTK